METVGGIEVTGSSKTVRRKRSNPFRRPRDEADSLPEYRNSPSLSSTPNSVSASKASSDDNNGDLGMKFNSLNVENVRSTLGHPKVVSEGESKLKKVKLKLGGVTHTIHTKNSSDGSSLAGPSSTKSSYSAYAPRHTRTMLIDQGTPDGESFFTDKKSGLRGVPWKDFSKVGFGVGNYDASRQIISEERISIKQYDTDVAARKSKRVQKRRLSRGALGDDDDDNDDEIRYLEKLRSAIKFSARYEDEDEFGSSKHRPLSVVLNRRIIGGNMDLKDHNVSRTGKESRKLRLEKTTEDTDYADEESFVSDTEPRLEPKKSRIKEMPNVSGESGQEIAVTTRRRALMSGSSSSVIEFPNGLPPAPSKKQKEQLSEVEQQLRRAEALQRRRMQVEKANRESEAEAIRKILGQDSSRKKREEIVKKRQEEKTASYLTVPSDAVRWVMGPAGTVVIFPEEIGLPSIFEQKASSYPPAREKCSGPSCLNDYKYRDSKSKLPLCSLRCYKAVHQKIPPLTAC